MPSRLKTLALVVALFVAPLAVGGASPASANAASLPAGLGGIVVDDANDHVFVSSPGGNSVSVLDFDGNIVHTITELAGPASMVVSGSKLYVALSLGGTVDAYDTRTYERVGRYGTDILVRPGPLAMAGGKLWTSTGNCAQWGTKLASIDVSSSAKTVRVHEVPTMLGYCIGLANQPNNTNQLLAWNLGLSPASTFRFDVSSGDPVLAVERRQENLGNLRQLAVTPDGTRFVAASGAPYEIDQFRMSDQLQDGIIYPTGHYPNAVAVTGARGGLLAAGRDGYYDNDIDVFVLGEPAKRIFQHDFGVTGTTLSEKGLAFSPEGERLFAVSQGSNGNTFHVFDLSSSGPTPTTTTTRPPTTTTTRPPTTTTTTRPPTTPTTVPPTTSTSTTTTTLPSVPVTPGWTSGPLDDARGDVTDLAGARIAEPRADLATASASQQDQRLVLSMRAVQPTSPLSDPNWTDGSSYAAWPLDSDGDGEFERMAMVFTAAGSLQGVVATVSDPPSFLCAAPASFVDGTLSISVDLACAGGRPAGWGAFLVYNQGGPGSDGPYAIDFAPDGLNDLGTGLAEAELSSANIGTGGYWLLSAAGDVYGFGRAGHFGNEATEAIDIEPTPTAAGYWILGYDGRVHAKGDARHMGDAVLADDEWAVSLSATPSGRGYWVFTDRGRVFSFGDAPHRGDLAGVPLNGPVLGSVATPTGRGYWMVASDGGIFAFGDAVFSGSMGGQRLNQPVMSMAPDPDGRGYWLVASDGGIFAFDAPFYGSTGNLRLNRPISGMVPGRSGYLMVAEDGGIFAFGDVPFHGSLGANPPKHPIMAVALSPRP